MSARRWKWCTPGGVLATCLCVAAIESAGSGPRATDPPKEPASPEERAVAFLCREVPRWSRENHCFSCHNNADAAQALFQAAGAGYQVPEVVLADTGRWLKAPKDWDHNGGEGPFSDKRLAHVAFSAALATAVSTAWIKDRTPLNRAAERLAGEQSADGSWALEGDDSESSPAAYGRLVATFLARQTLVEADRTRFRAAIDRADSWVAGREIRSLADASVSLMMLGQAKRTPAGEKRRQACLDVLRRARTDEGGWGPRPGAPAEAFDTAIALLALSCAEESPEVRDLLIRGRAYLVAEQRDDGSWVETTRPPGGVSYAQRIATTGWATRALLATHKLGARNRLDAKR
jgi:Prenyltransferase and squalene oxidase repeat